jgi:hypothetical protein
MGISVNLTLQEIKYGVFLGNHQFNYGGDETNLLKDITINNNNEVYAIGQARDSQGGTNNIATPGAHKEHTNYQGQWMGYDTDSFIMKFNDSGVRIWGTYFGGDQFDTANSIVLDSSQNLIIGGLSTGNNGIVTQNEASKIIPICITEFLLLQNFHRMVNKSMVLIFF